MTDLFRDLEERLLQPKVRRSPDEAGKLLAADFIEFGSSGAVYSRQQILDGLPKGKSDGAVIGVQPRRSSIYQRRRNAWSLMGNG